MNSILGLFFGFDDTLWKIALLVAVVVIIGYCLRFKNGKIVIISCLSVLMLGFTTYCGVQLNDYYRAKGGIYGQLVSLYKSNEVEIKDDVSFSFKNINLTEDGDLYSAKITSDEVLDLVLDETATYGVYVNGIPCEYVNITQDYVIAKYRYTFYNDEFNLLMDDTLSFKFAFYTNSTYLIVSTSGGATASNYWTSFFNKNVFEVTIDNKGYSYSKDISFGIGDISNYSQVKYYVEDRLIGIDVYRNGTVINLPNDYDWDLEDGTSIDDTYIVTESITLNAHRHLVTFMLEDDVITTQLVLPGNYVTFPELPEGYNWIMTLSVEYLSTTATGVQYYYKDVFVKMTESKIFKDEVFVAYDTRLMDGTFKSSQYTFDFENGKLISLYYNDEVIDFESNNNGTYVWNNTYFEYTIVGFSFDKGWIMLMEYQNNGSYILSYLERV